MTIFGFIMYLLLGWCTFVVLSATMKFKVKINLALGALWPITAVISLILSMIVITKNSMNE